MKRRDLIKLLEKNGWILIRDDGDHTVYGKDGQIEPIPRHKEIKETTAKSIIKRRGLK